MPTHTGASSQVVRNNLVEVSSHNQLPGAVEPHSSVRYISVSPVAGAVFHASSAVNIYAAYGKGFETPTLNDLAYRSSRRQPAGTEYRPAPGAQR